MNPRVFFTAFLLFAVSSVMCAGGRYIPHVTIGAHGGYALSRMSFSPSVSQSWLNGFTAGISARYAEDKLFGLGAELNITQRGWKQSFKDNPQLEYQRQLTYVELPVLTHISFGGKRVKAFVDLGPEVALMVGENISSNFNYADPTSAGLPSTQHVAQMTLPIKNKFDYGICVGLGGEFYLQPRHSITLGARLYYGLGSVFGSAKADAFNVSRAMSINATLGYSFRIK